MERAGRGAVSFQLTPGAEAAEPNPIAAQPLALPTFHRDSIGGKRKNKQRFLLVQSIITTSNCTCRLFTMKLLEAGQLKGLQDVYTKVEAHLAEASSDPPNLPYRSKYMALEELARMRDIVTELGDGEHQSAISSFLLAKVDMNVPTSVVIVTGLAMLVL